MWVTSKSFWRCVFNSEVKLFQCDDWLTILILYNNEYTIFLYVSLIYSFYLIYFSMCNFRCKAESAAVNKEKE